mmetsp:Transcript_52029/g.139346  ORF Transcript_52029/g.139346 Transcript_52029/m.139346 type:complete len:229 (-) Transcript_52029:565-1251(-)
MSSSLPLSRKSRSLAFSLLPPRACFTAAAWPSARDVSASTASVLPLAVTLGSRAASELAAPASTAIFWASGPARTMLASAPAPHSAAWMPSALRSSTSAGTTSTAFSAFSGEPAVMFISAPAAYSLAMTSPIFSIFMRCSRVPLLASSIFTSGQRQERFMMPRAASATMSFSSVSKGLPAPCCQTASHGPSSAASIARACAAWRLASSVRPSARKISMRDGIISGASS